jgi:hypothetical protein
VASPRCIVALVGLTVVALTGGWSLGQRATMQRRRLLARACLGLEPPFALVATGDDALLRAFLRRRSPLAHAGRLDDVTADALARVGGVDAVPLLIDALSEDATGFPDFYPERQAAWPHLRALDPRLDALFAAVRREPERFGGLVVSRIRALAARHGRAAALEALGPALGDIRVVGGLSGSHAMRVCDYAAVALPRLLSPMPFGWPIAPSLIDTPYFDEGLRRTRAWLATSPRLKAAGWIVFDVRGAVVMGGTSSVLLQGEWWDERSTATGDDHLHVGGPYETPQRYTVTVRDAAASGGGVTVDIAVRPGETAWVRVDLERCTATTETLNVPP